MSELCWRKLSYRALQEALLRKPKPLLTSDLCYCCNICTRERKREERRKRQPWTVWDRKEKTKERTLGYSDEGDGKREKASVLHREREVRETVLPFFLMPCLKRLWMFGVISLNGRECNVYHYCNPLTAVELMIKPDHSGGRKWAPEPSEVSDFSEVCPDLCPLSPNISFIL